MDGPLGPAEFEALCASCAPDGCVTVRPKPRALASPPPLLRLKIPPRPWLRRVALALRSARERYRILRRVIGRRRALLAALRMVILALRV